MCSNVLFLELKAVLGDKCFKFQISRMFLSHLMAIHPLEVDVRYMSIM